MLCSFLYRIKIKIKETIKDANGNKVPGYKFRVLKATDKGATVKNYAVDLGQSYINSADIKINTQNNNLICSGFTTTKIMKC